MGLCYVIIYSYVMLYIIDVIIYIIVLDGFLLCYNIYNYVMFDALQN